MAEQAESAHFVFWNWTQAPEQFKTLSRHGGDEDYVIWTRPDSPMWSLPVALWPLESVISGEETSWAEGFGHVDRHELGNGEVVIIFAHA